MRLIDKDKLKFDMQELVFDGEEAYKVFGYSAEQIDAAPTIVLPPNNQPAIEKIVIYRKTGSVEVLILPHKDGSGYSFVNLTKGHICPCKFATIQDAIADLNSKKDVLGYEFLTGKVVTNGEKGRR